MNNWNAQLIITDEAVNVEEVWDGIGPHGWSCLQSTEPGDRMFVFLNGVGTVQE